MNKTNLTIYNRSLYLLICLGWLTAISCKKFVEITPPAQQVTTAQLFSDSATAMGVLNGVYMQMSNLGDFSFGMTENMGLYADELDITTGDLQMGQFYQSDVLYDNYTVGGTWSDAYQYIYASNLCIERAAQSSIFSSAAKDLLMGESKFLRALSYYYLVRLFGDIPLVLSSDYRVSASIGRTAQAQVLTQIVSDLQDAENLLSSDYPGTEPVWANKWAAAALLARVYLYQKDWPNAEKEASNVIGSGKYALQTNLNNVFLKDNEEAIWQLMPTDGSAMYEGFYFIPGDAVTLPNYPMTISILNAFEPGDQRRQAWVDSTIIGGQAYYYPYKYKTTGSTPSTEYYTLLRLGEQYLIRSEAGAEQGKLASAAQDLNMIRSRAGLPPATASDQASLLQAIYHERQVELFAENGQRWFDLQRTGMADSVLKVLKPQTWKKTAVLLPIPVNELKSNPLLTQNEGY
jgi:hypothetical protein